MTRKKAWLGYAFAVLSFSAPVYGCARPAAKGINKLPQMMAAAAGTGELCLPRVYESSEGNGSLSFELSLFNAIILDTLDTPVCGYSRMRDTVIFSVSHPYTWVRPMARWLVGNSLLRQLSTLPTLHSGIWVLLLLYWDTDKALITDKITLVQTTV